MYCRVVFYWFGCTVELLFDSHVDVGHSGAYSHSNLPRALARTYDTLRTIPEYTVHGLLPALTCSPLEQNIAGVLVGNEYGAVDVELSRC